MAGDSENEERGGGRTGLKVALLTSLFWVTAGGAALFLWRRPEPVVFAVQPPPATATPRPSPTPTATATPAPLLVDVGGAVQVPGLYQLPPGSRLGDAVHAAGGLLPQAEPASISLAQPLADGAKVYVPAAGETPPPAPAGAVRLDSSPASGSLVNINTATQEALEALPGIGPATAQAIIAYRQANGPFPTIESITEVKGIGEATLERLRPLIAVE